MSKPGLPQGTRDFGPETVYKRNFIFETIRSVFECYGFEPLETPAMENLDTLLGKYGEEGDQLIFKILNNGLDHVSKKETARVAFENILNGKNDKGITERALRYDLTIPFARYVAMHQHEIPFPYRRYQLQPVWRADRPQKGRYREFYQCDADVVGSRSLMNEVELAQIYLDVFKKLGIDVELRINHRKILAGLAENCGGADKSTLITTAIDKLDKIGIGKVKEELREKNLTDAQVELVEKYLHIKGNHAEKIHQLAELLPNEWTQAGIADLHDILKFFTLEDPLVLDFSLARGLNYYTGIIFEVRARGVQIGSIGGGGRYDDLTGLFGVPGIPGVGISFGVDRIYDVMEELKCFPPAVHRSTRVLFFNLGEEAADKSFELMQELRRDGIRCELYPEPVKFDKQFKYAEKKNIPRVLIIGPDELLSGKAKIKNLVSGVQEEVRFEELRDLLKAERSTANA
ncbi:MAG TPA: histidine--tRNA ligase [Chitinophagaceae bacterium]|jgi:histidyl-tRNA synthetase|nr:histidine--tRNA ligase [Chitinophagaceae bacterium]